LECEDDGRASIDEKLFGKKILALIRHGRNVIKTYSGEETKAWTLKQYLGRPYRTLLEEDAQSRPMDRVRQTNETFSTMDLHQNLDQASAKKPTVVQT